MKPHLAPPRLALPLLAALAAVLGNAGWQAASGQCSNSKQVKLDVTGAKVVSVSGTASWAHAVTFFPVTTHDSPPLAPMTSGKVPVTVTGTAGFGPKTVQEPASGVYHGGAIACSGFSMGALATSPFNPKTTLIRGAVSWDQTPPRPSLLHKEYTGTTVNSTQLLGKSVYAIDLDPVVKFGFAANSPDDMITGGGHSVSAYDTDLEQLVVNDATVFEQFTRATSTGGGLVQLQPANGLLLTAGSSATAGFEWSFSPANAQNYFYYASLNGTTFSASANWLDLWQISTSPSGVMSAFLSPELVPVFDWESDPYTEPGTFEFRREGEGSITAEAPPVPEPVSGLLVATGLGALAAARLRKRHHGA